MNIFKKISLAYDISKAYSFASEGKHKEALNIIDKDEHYFRERTDRFTDIFILKGSLYFEIGNFELAETYFYESAELLKKECEYNDDEKSFLLSYIYIYLANLYYQIENDSWRTFNEAATQNKYDLKRVRKTLQLNFPIRSEP